MAEIIDLAAKRADKKPHVTGEARCMLCGHVWKAVEPAGTTWLECPVCRCQKGYFVYPVQRTGFEWRCLCGNDLMRVTPDGYYCPNCGAWQEMK